jgi:hypothetical protein
VVAEGRGLGQVGDAERPAREIDPVAGDQRDQEREGQRHDHEGVAVGAQGRIADRQRHGGVQERRPHNAPPEIAAEGDDGERRHVAADTPEAELGEG